MRPFQEAFFDGNTQACEDKHRKSKSGGYFMVERSRLQSPQTKQLDNTHSAVEMSGDHKHERSLESGQTDAVQY